MARNNRNRSSRPSARRDTQDIANRRLPRQELKFNYEPTSTRFRKLRNLSNAEDRRRFHPDRGARSLKNIYGDPNVRQIAAPIQSKRGTTVSRQISKRKSYTFSTMFDQPKEVSVCVRRQQRKEVINALRKNGKGGGQRAPRYNWRSKIRCK